MLGRAVLRSARDVLGDGAIGTSRRRPSEGPGVSFIADLTDRRTLVQLLETLRPGVVINCAGVLRGGTAADLDRVNARLPHDLAEAADATGARVIHVSTDGVFSGTHGPSDETTPPDPIDAYGRSKLAGELTASPHLTVRTSIIGRRPDGQGLVEWAVAQRGGTVQGHARSLWSGVTAPELARLLVEHVVGGDPASGIVHVQSEAVSKAELLRRIDRAFGLGLTVDDVEEPVVDRRLVSTRRDIVLRARPHNDQLDELVSGGT